MADKETIGEQDRAFEAIFSAFNDVHASDELKAKTLAALGLVDDGQDRAATPEFSVVSAGSEGLAVVSEQDMSVTTPEPEERCYYCASQSPGARSRVRAKTTPVRHNRAFQFLAAAACLALVLFAGVTAYATPSAEVSVGTEEAAVSLGVNFLGMTVKADSLDEQGQEILSDLQLNNMPYEEALDKVLDKLDKKGNGETPIALEVAGGFGSQGEGLEERSVKLFDERGLTRGDHELLKQRGSAVDTGQQESQTQAQMQPPTQAEPQTPTQQQPQLQPEKQGQEQGQLQGQQSQGQQPQEQPQLEQQGEQLTQAMQGSQQAAGQQAVQQEQQPGNQQQMQHTQQPQLEQQSQPQNNGPTQPLSQAPNGQAQGSNGQG